MIQEFLFTSDIIEEVYEAAFPISVKISSTFLFLINYISFHTSAEVWSWELVCFRRHAPDPSTPARQLFSLDETGLSGRGIRFHCCRLPPFCKVRQKGGAAFAWQFVRQWAGDRAACRDSDTRACAHTHDCQWGERREEKLTSPFCCIGCLWRQSRKCHWG